MKKMIAVAAIALGLAGCGNVDMFDTVWTYDYALTKWPDGTVKKIEIGQWRDYEGEQIQITAKDGNVYLLSMNSTVLVAEKTKK